MVYDAGHAGKWLGEGRPKRRPCRTLVTVAATGKFFAIQLCFTPHQAETVK
jgi:hypothetical protein